MSRLLIDESPLQVLPSLAVSIGLNEAVVLQQVHYWLKRSTVNKDNHAWVYNTVQQWQEQFPFWSPDTVRRTLASLRDKGLLIAERLSENRFDKTLYYRINYQQLQTIVDGILQSSEYGNLQPSDHGNLPPSTDAECNDDYIETETTTEITKTTKKKLPAATPKVAAPELPEWIDSETWDAFVEMRKRIKKPMTDRAVELMLAKLARFKDAGHDPNALLETSIINCWQNVYEPKENRARRPATGAARPSINDFTDGDDAFAGMRTTLC